MINQLIYVHEVHIPDRGDFLVDQTWLLEVGGPRKTPHQIVGIPNAYVITDDFTNVVGNKIPIWLMGLLY